MAERDADVVVVGGGGAGLAAAVAAAQAGARVVVLERGAEAGGKTALAMGSFTASETGPQRRNGVEDSNAAHREDLLAHLARHGAAMEPDDPSLDILVEDGAGSIAWLEELGVRFSGPHPERPHRTYRLHCALPDGSAYVRCLARALADLGGSLRCGQRVTDLRRTADGALALAVEGQAGRLVAGAVVLAAGDYSAAIDRLRPGEGLPVEPLRDWARGDAQCLGHALGGVLAYMRSPIAPAVRFVDPPHTEPDAALYAAGAILVDERGGRLDRDGEPLGRTPAVVVARHAYTVFGGELAERMARASDDGPYARDGWWRTGRLFICTTTGRGYDYLEDIVQRPGCGRGESPEALGAAVGIDGVRLAATLDALNRERAAQDRYLPIARPPYYALGPLRARLLLTWGGLRTSAALQVLGDDGTPLPGLFAAGGAAASMPHAGAHGLGIGWAISSGRRGGQSAARAALQSPT